MSATRLRGPQFVLILYALLVAISGLAGFLMATFVSGLRAPKFLFLVPFPPTQLGFAAYGALTVGLALGVPLLLVVYVSRNLDDSVAQNK